MTTKEFPWLYQESVVASQAMQAAGLNVRLDLTDWATLVARRAKPDGWELFGGSPTFVPDPLLTLYALLVASAIGVPAGILAAVLRNSWVDRLAMMTALAGVSIPGFWRESC